MLLDLLEEVLLRADDAPRPADAHPRDCLGGREAVVLHQVRADAGAGPTQARLAVHREGLSLRGAGFERRNDLHQDFHRRTRTVQKERVDVTDPSLDEVLLVVAALVESHHQSDVLPLDVRDVVGRRERTVAFGRNVAFK